MAPLVTSFLYFGSSSGNFVANRRQSGKKNPQRQGRQQPGQGAGGLPSLPHRGGKTNHHRQFRRANGPTSCPSGIRWSVMGIASTLRHSGITVPCTNNDINRSRRPCKRLGHCPLMSLGGTAQFLARCVRLGKCSGLRPERCSTGAMVHVSTGCNAPTWSF